MKTIGKRETILSLLKHVADDSIQPDEFTISEYVEIAAKEGRPMKRKRAGEILNRLVWMGSLPSVRLVLTQEL